MAKKSIVTDDMEHCYICGSPYVQIHHCIHGTANRKMADKYKLVIPLCMKHHTGSMESVHRNPDMDLKIKQIAQEAFESKKGNREDFIRIFGKSYL